MCLKAFVAFATPSSVSGKASLEMEKLWLRQEAERWGLKFNLEAISSQEECRSTPALIHASESMVQGDGPQLSGSLSNLADTYTRLSVSLEENGLYKAASPISFLGLDPDELKAVNRYAESTKSLSFLPQVHERQTARMRTRSEWFLNPSPCPSPTPIQVPPEIDENEEVAIKAGWANRRIARHMGQSDAAIRRCWKEWVDHGRFQHHDGSVSVMMDTAN
ncbi:uncharacterized protein TNCV_4374281 [Trichonephila clavipes]|uniref:Uncharacterized protein n=1 Tax=Trichonephila clavipes TaxID=2585209 RepID=A0A8X6UY67_TRICX|nr:uncharacterized protein TNCV_4374281 [Trichonephila clavipes]